MNRGIIWSLSTSIFDILKKVLEMKDICIAMLHLKLQYFRYSSDCLTSYLLMPTKMQFLVIRSFFIESEFWIIFLLVFFVHIICDYSICVVQEVCGI